MESLRKIPSGWECEKKARAFPIWRKKGKNILEMWLFLSLFQKELTWIVLLGLHPHLFVGKGRGKSDADPKMFMSVLKNFFSFSKFVVVVVVVVVLVSKLRPTLL